MRNAYFATISAVVLMMVTMIAGIVEAAEEVQPTHNAAIAGKAQDIAKLAIIICADVKGIRIDASSKLSKNQSKSLEKCGDELITLLSKQ